MARTRLNGRLLSRLSSILRCESGQASAEYIIMLSMIVLMLITVVRKLLRPVFEDLKGALIAAFESQLFPSGEGFHRLRIRR